MFFTFSQVKEEVTYLFDGVVFGEYAFVFHSIFNFYKDSFNWGIFL